MQKELKLRDGKAIQSGDIIFITLNPNNPEILAKARFVDFTTEGNIKLYVIDPDYKLVDIEVKQERIVKIEKPN